MSETYWNLPAGPIRERSLDSACEELDSLLQQSVREHLLSDVPLGLWLSGGIDSSTVLHYAATASSRPIKTLSVSFLGRSFDETAYIRSAAKKYGTDHQEFDLNPGADLRGAIEEFAYYSDEPSSDAGALPVWFLSKMSRTEVTVALSGEGADELFGGYLTYRANQLAQADAAGCRSGRYARGWGLLVFGQCRMTRSAANIWRSAFWREVSCRRNGAHVYWNGTFSGAEARSLSAIPLPNSLDNILGELRNSPAAQDGVSPYLWCDQKYFLPDDILNKVDRMSMAHSLEVRPPFLDHRIVEFAATLPPALKIQGSRQKIVLKQLMKDKLPEMILRRKKVGFDIPAHEWMRGPLRELLLDTMREGLAEHKSVFRVGAVQELVRLHLERRINVGYHLWGLLLLFLWMKKWRIQMAPSPASASWIQEKTGIST